MAEAEVIPNLSEQAEPTSPTSPTSPNEKRALQESPPEWRERRLYQMEFAMLRYIQRAVPQWLMLPLALVIHRVASEALLIPLVGIFTWAVSMPATASTATCACLCVSLNFGLKWIWQRPRPLWLDNGKVSDVWNIGNVWEGDYSFPSGHAQSLSGVLLCSFFTFKLPIVWLPVMLLFGAFIAVSRNYLGVHWCSDTFTGWAIGSFTGILWGVLDPYDALLRREDPFLSLAVGMCFALGLIALSAFSLAVTTPVEPELRAEWLDTAVRGLEAFKCSQVVPEDEMDEARGRMILRCGASSRPRRLRSRHLVYAAGPAIGGGVCLALTRAYPELPPHVFHCLELRAPLHVAILRVLVGSTGVALLLLALACPLYVVRNAPLEGRTGAMKVALLLLPLTLAPVWVFFLSQLVMEELGLGCTGDSPHHPDPGLRGPVGPGGPGLVP